MNVPKLFWIALLVVLLVKAAALVFLPETELVDAMFHLRQAEAIRDSWGIDAGLLQIALPSYYLLVTALLSFLPLALPFTKLVPLALTLAYAALCFLFFRRAFGERFRLPFLLAAALPTFTIFGSVNYTDQFAALAVLAAAYFLLAAEQKPSRSGLLVAGLLAAFLPLTRLNAALAFPPLFLGWLRLGRKTFSWKGLLAVAFVLLVVAGSWQAQRLFSERCFEKGLSGCGGIPDFGKNFQGLNVSRDIGTPEASVALEKAQRLPLPDTAFRALLDLWNFPPYATAEALLGSQLTLVFAGLFFLLALAFTWLTLRGAWGFLHSSPAFQALALAFLFNQYTTVHGVFIAGGLSEYARLSMPTAFLGVAMLCAGWRSLPRPRLPQAPAWGRKVLRLALLLFLAYSLLYSLAFTAYFHGVYAKHEGLYAFAGTLPPQAKVFSSTRFQQLSFLTGLEAGGKDYLFGKDIDAPLVESVLLGQGFTHLAWTCYKDLVPRSLIDRLEAGGRLKPIYSDSCTRVYEVRR